jgi:hypothetical protein
VNVFMHCGTLWKNSVFCCMHINLGWQECELKYNGLACMEIKKKIWFSMLYFVNKYRISQTAMQLGSLEPVYDIYWY